jgi:hypothetical protein
MIFSCGWRIGRDLQGFCRDGQNDAEMIGSGFRPKLELGLRMRPNAINSIDCNVATYYTRVHISQQKRGPEGPEENESGHGRLSSNVSLCTSK